MQGLHERHAAVDGMSRLENDLIDEYRLMVFPTILGAGKRLFGELSDAASLRLVDSKPAGETLILTYEPARTGAQG